MIAEKNGFTNVGNEYFKRGSTDLYPVATRLVGVNPDLIDFGGTIGRDQGLACKALRELGYKGKIMLGYSDAKSFVESPGRMRPRARCCSTRWRNRRMPQQKELQDWWLKKYGPPFPSFAFLDVGLAVHPGAWRSEGAVGRSGAVAEALRRHSWTGLFGESVRHEVGLRHRLLADPADPDVGHQGRQADAA